MPRPDNPNNDDDMNETLQKQPELIDHPSYEEVLKKLDAAEQRSDQLLRMQADSENALRRAEREVGNAHKYALEKFAKELLPIVDSLELCVSSAAKETNQAAQSVIEGADLTLKMFYTTLEKFGIKQVNPLAKPFDPEFQQAISMQYDPNAQPGEVLSVLQKGYTLNNRLLRPALVVVAKAEA